MDESEWLSCADPDAMLRSHPGPISARKLRLFGVACCRRAWHLLDEESRSAVAMIEQTPDGPEKCELWAHVELDGRLAGIDHSPSQLLDVSLPVWGRIALALCAGRATAVRSAADNILGSLLRGVADGESERERPFQCGLLREILGNPFRPVVFDPAWRTPLIVQFAHAINKYRGYDLHPHLAKALGAAGCTDADILSHCREPGGHVPGCWVVDLILGKE